MAQARSRQADTVKQQQPERHRRARPALSCASSASPPARRAVALAGNVDLCRPCELSARTTASTVALAPLLLGTGAAARGGRPSSTSTSRSAPTGTTTPKSGRRTRAPPPRAAAACGRAGPRSTPPTTTRASRSWRRRALLRRLDAVQLVALLARAQRDARPHLRRVRPDLDVCAAAPAPRTAYDNAADPYQLKSLAASADPGALAALHAELEAYRCAARKLRVQPTRERDFHAWTGGQPRRAVACGALAGSRGTYIAEPVRSGTHCAALSLLSSVAFAVAFAKDCRRRSKSNLTKRRAPRRAAGSMVHHRLEDGGAGG